MDVFIDESGNLGRCGSFFVIAALMPSNKNRLKNIATSTLASLRAEGSLSNELKASDLPFSVKQHTLRRIASKDDFSCAYIAAEKAQIQNERLRSDTNLCFNYLAKHLFKHVILSAPSKDTAINVILDNRNIKTASLHTLQDYIRITAYTEWKFEGTLTFRFMDSKDVKNLQIVDLIANTVYGSYEYEKHHLLDIIRPHISAQIKFP